MNRSTKHTVYLWLTFAIFESALCFGPHLWAVSLIKNFQVILAAPGPEPVTILGGHSFSFFGKSKIQVSFSLSSSRLYKNLFVLPDDCLNNLRVNGQSFSSPKIPFCNYTNGVEFDLSPVLVPSRQNQIEMEIENTGGLGKIYVIPRMKKKFRLFQSLASLILTSGFLIMLTYPLRHRE